MKFSKILNLFALLILFMSCSDANDVAGEGHLNVYLTDAPFPYESVAEANVTVFKVEARLKEGASDEMNDTEMEDATTDDPDTDSSPYIVLMEEEIDVNLLDLTNGVTAQLAGLDVPAGTYDLVRLHVRGVNVVLTTGETFDLKVPSGDQTGIKIFVKPGIQVSGGLSADLLLDFDVSRSFVAKGGPKAESITGFNFKPVVKASNVSTTGTIAGIVSTETTESEMLALEGVQISILQEGEVITTAFSDADGNYAVMGLDPGEYNISAELEGYVPVEAGPVTVTVANVSNQSITMEAVME